MGEIIMRNAVKREKGYMLGTPMASLKEVFCK